MQAYKPPPSRVAVGEAAVKIGTEQRWLYAAIDIETKLLLDVVMISDPRGTDSEDCRAGC